MPIAGVEYGFSSQNMASGQEASAESVDEALHGPQYGTANTTLSGRNEHVYGQDTVPEDSIVTSIRAGQESQQQRIARIKQEQRRQWFPSSMQATSNNDSNSTFANNTPTTPSLLPPALITTNTEREISQHDREQAELGRNIERPRSALHSGDFTQSRSSGRSPQTPIPSKESHPWISTSPIAPWSTASALHSARLSRLQTQQSPPNSIADSSLQGRSRAASYSALSSGYVYRPPTSPLVMQSNSNDLDSSDESTKRRSRSPDKSYRRRTFSPSSFQVLNAAQHGYNYNDTQVHSPPGYSPPSLKRDNTYPAQAHQPRRSITFLQASPTGTDSGTPTHRSRRPSMSDNSPIQGASLVGRYEESILRGRMSTLPSLPVNFLAEIGVLGKGKCKSSLRCPAHLTIPFPAVFYDYNFAPRDSSPSSGGPSPYVGQIDLEDYERPGGVPDLPSRDQSPGSDRDSHPEDKRRQFKTSSAIRHHRHRHRPPPKGAYRIPQQGQLQIVIKNPNKTAVKLFLIPYDLSGMMAGQKTFIRQRSYSWGPIIDMPLSACKNIGTDIPEAALSNADDPKSRPVLRYLIHLHICCPSRGRFYLYRNVRVVFANRVPDGKEKLRVETQLPEPRYSTYKPETRSMHEGVVLPLSNELFSYSRPTALTHRATSAGEFTIHLPNPFTSIRPTYHMDSHDSERDDSRALTKYDFHRQKSSVVQKQRDPFTSQVEADLSPKSSNSGHATDPMSWTQDIDAARQSAQSGLGIGMPKGPLSGQYPLSRPSTPQAGREGLLALQLRDWTGRDIGKCRDD